MSPLNKESDLDFSFGQRIRFMIIKSMIYCKQLNLSFVSTISLTETTDEVDNDKITSKI
jgi:hypothetical protein